MDKNHEDKKYVYIVYYEGQVINVYNEYMDALERAIAEAGADCNYTYIDSFEHIIYVDGDKGLVMIAVEELL